MEMEEREDGEEGKGVAYKERGAYEGQPQDCQARGTSDGPAICGGGPELFLPTE